MRRDYTVVNLKQRITQIPRIRKRLIRVIGVIRSLLSIKIPRSSL